jgi:hypothetical protein
LSPRSTATLVKKREDAKKAKTDKKKGEMKRKYHQRKIENSEE